MKALALLSALTIGCWLAYPDVALAKGSGGGHGRLTQTRDSTLSRP